MAGPRMSEPLVVLVVDDEAILRMTAADMVEDAGFRALEAADADDAVRLLEARDDIRALLTDVDMPGTMNGIRLAAHVRDRWPLIKIIMVSGKVRLRPEDVPERAVFFSKPYVPRDLVKELRRLLA